MKNLITILIVLLNMLFSFHLSFADVHLSVNPADGSNNIRFDRMSADVENKKEVRVRVSATGGHRYQVFQRVLEPLVNERGESLDLQVVQVATLMNSNQSGTLYLQNIDRLSMGEQLIYTSGQGGESDSFVLAYVVDPTFFRNSGSFGGRILFTARSMGESSQDQVAVNISVEAQSSWKVDVSGGHAKSQVRVKDADVSAVTADFVKISFSGNTGKEVRIYQEVDGLPQNTIAQEMGADVLLFSVEAGQDQGVRVPAGSSLAKRSDLVFSGQESENDIILRFFVDPLRVATEDAGLYVGKIKYVIETNDKREEFLIDLELSIQPVFNIEVSLPPEGVSFNNVLPNAPAMEREVTVVVSTNLHRPYQVLQDLQTPMVNGKGNEIKKEYFNFKVESPSGAKTQTKFKDFSPMETGEYSIYSSDSEGSPSTFKVVYRLQGYPLISGGNFAAPIRFSLNQN